MVHQKNIITAGKPLSEARKILIMIHGRGGSAEDILSLSQHLLVNDFALQAPQASQHTWYPYSFLSPPDKNEPGLSSALQILGEMVEDLKTQGFKSDQIYFLGFSQGACLALEFVTRNADKYGGIVALTGGLIGDKIYSENYKGDFKQTPVFIGSSDPDMHVPVERVKETTRLLTSMGARVSEKIYENMGHTISSDEINRVNAFIFSEKA